MGRGKAATKLDVPISTLSLLVISPEKEKFISNIEFMLFQQGYVDSNNNPTNKLWRALDEERKKKGVNV